MGDEIKIPAVVMVQATTALEATSMSGVPARQAFAQFIARWMREECAKVADRHDKSCGENPQDYCSGAIAEEIRKVGT